MLKDKIEKRKKMDKKKAAVIGLSIAVAAGGAAAGGVAYANEVELEETKDKAYATVQQVDVNKYDTEEARQVQQLIDNAKANIEKAESVNEVNGLVATFESSVSGVQTASQKPTRAESLESARESAREGANEEPLPWVDTEYNREGGYNSSDNSSESYASESNSQSTTDTVKKPTRAESLESARESAREGANEEPLPWVDVQW